MSYAYAILSNTGEQCLCFLSNNRDWCKCYLNNLVIDALVTCASLVNDVYVNRASPVSDVRVICITVKCNIYAACVTLVIDFLLALSVHENLFHCRRMCVNCPIILQWWHIPRILFTFFCNNECYFHIAFILSSLYRFILFYNFLQLFSIHFFSSFLHMSSILLHIFQQFFPVSFISSFL